MVTGSHSNSRLTCLRDLSIIRERTPCYIVKDMLLSNMLKKVALLFVLTWLSPVLIAGYFLPRSIKRRILLKFFDLMDKPSGVRSYEDNVLPHGPLVQHYNNLWSLTGSLPEHAPKLPRNMVIYRPPGTSKLVVHSPLCVREDVVKEIEALGEISYIIVPNRAHRLDSGSWAARYPDAKIMTPSFAREYVDNRVPHCYSCEKEMAEFPNQPSADRIPGVSYMRIGHEQFELAYVMNLEGASKPNSLAVVVCDAFFNLNKDKAHWMSRLMGSADGFGMTKLGVVLADDLKTMLEWVCKLRDNSQKIPIESIFMAHGDPVIGNDKVEMALNRSIYKLIRAM